jgi:hypothetical protein
MLDACKSIIGGTGLGDNQSDKSAMGYHRRVMNKVATIWTDSSKKMKSRVLAIVSCLAFIGIINVSKLVNKLV